MASAVTPLSPRADVGNAAAAAVTEGHSSGVSWAAVSAGAFATAALSLALLALGTGIGLSVTSPWANAEASTKAIGRTAILWVILMQVIAASVGGYLAGRLRTKWVNVHTHEVYFRDTAHGFLAWAVGLVIAVAFLTSAGASAIGGAARAGATAVEVSGRPSDGVGADRYIVDTLLRSRAPLAERDDTAMRSELGLILTNGLRAGGLPPADRTYLAQTVAARTGASQAEAENRVDEAFARAQQAADNARKAVAHSMYWTFLALLTGAFCASVAATLGGKERDHSIVD
jgi:hypothetical protein